MRPTFYTLDDFIGLANTVTRFVGKDAVQRAIDEIDKQGFHRSESRVALLQRAQPILIGLGKLEKLIQSGIELSADNLNFEINMLAYAGMLLRSIQDTLPAKLAKAHASRLMDLHGKAHSVLLEWEQASLYRRHGYEIIWLDANTPGPEFFISKGELKAAIECRRFGPNAIEIPRVRGLAEIADEVRKAMISCGVLGLIHIRLEKPETVDCAALAQAARVAVLNRRAHVRLPDIAEITLHYKNSPRTKEELATEANKYPGSRTFCKISPDGLGSQSIIISGQAQPLVDFADRIKQAFKEKALQLPTDRAGFISMQVAGMHDTAALQGAFRSFTQQLFDDNPHVAGIVWRPESEFVKFPSGYQIRSDHLAARNTNCIFKEAAEIPLGDFVIP